MKNLLAAVFITLFFVGINSCEAENGRFESTRKAIDFDWGWKFALGEQVAAEKVSFDDSGWRELDLPHDWSNEGPFAEDNPAGPRGGYLPGGIGWYRKQFTLPESSHGKRIRIEFDGVYWQRRVWINGHLLDFRPSGYMSFSYDLTDRLNSGGKEYVIAVRVDNSRMPNARWYTASGIYRHTRPVVTDPLRIRQWGTTWLPMRLPINRRG